jgi:tetraacyldisaccharide 4'-kinase
MSWLWPLGALYGGIAAARVAAYRRRLFKAQRLTGPVISVGNLSVGGSGKTPVVERIAQLLCAEGLPVAILSRGYRGSFRGESLIVADGRKLLADAAEAGDEPVMLARALPGVVVAVGPSRDSVGRAVESRFGPRVHVLDDGFQHLGLARDLDVLCLEAADLHDWPLPAGRLREFPSAYRRADVLLVNGGEWPHGGSFRVKRRVLGFFGPEGSEQAAPRRPWLVSGIARPERFHADVRERVASVAGSDTFSDHHRFRAAEWADVQRRAGAAGADALVTTAKDAVRLPAPSGALPVVVLRIAAEIEDEPRFRERLLAVARRVA